MAPWLSRLNITSIDGTSLQPGAHGSTLEILRDLLAACRRAWAAADHYEDLQALSDQALAEKGLERKDLPRAAFDRLTREH